MSTDHHHHDAAPLLHEISRQFLNSYFHLMCREPAEAELHAFFNQQKIDLVSQYTQCSEEQMLDEAKSLARHIQHKQKLLKPLRRSIIYAMLVGIAVVAGMFYTQFHWATFIALIIAYVLARNARRDYTYMEYQLLALNGLAHILKEKFDIECIISTP